MSSQSISQQLISLVEETREHTLYLQELGVESFKGEASKGLAPTPRALPTSSRQVESTTLHLQEQPVGAEIRSAAQPLAPRTISNTPDTLFGNIFQAPEELLPESHETFEQIWSDVGPCTRCPLSEGRTNIVHTEGNPRARLMFVGEAPGADEDIQARPFVGRAGQL